VQALVRLYSSQRMPEAKRLAEELARQFPEHPFAWKALGAMLRELGRIGEATDALRRAARLADDAESYNNLGLVLQEAGELAPAEESYRQALRRRPDLVEALANLGRLCHATGRFAEAERFLRAALRERPDLAEAHNTLAAVLKDCGRLAESEQAARDAVACNPSYPEAYATLGAVLVAMGRLQEGEEKISRALDLRPDFLEAFSALLYVRQFSNDQPPQAALDEARRFGTLASARVRNRYTSWRAARPPQRLRIGLVSGDLRDHPVGHFIQSVLAQVDQACIEVFAYPTYRASDALTDQLREACAAWHPIFGMNDADAAQRIYDDGIQVLVDLAGHTAHNRLPLFAYRPAPVQVTWLGYFATTGVAEIDYLLGDAVSIPPANEAHFTETVYRLPDSRLCFTPPALDVAIAPLPALAEGYVTFGSFQNLSKINDSVLALWGRVLAAVPGARLRVQNKQFADASIRRCFVERLERAGIDSDRASLYGPQLREEYLAAHGEVDVILDTFPFPGGTTTCEALWMGVPTLTLAGDRLIGLQGASLLTAAGLPDWIAKGPDHFVEVARRRAEDLAALSVLRGSLRTKLLGSALCDAARFARNLEAALWALWRQRMGS
jgi:predicted O-linked N-acetylglucosamine transferase (SPINDLY family)